jgi:hypothetical protein
MLISKAQGLSFYELGIDLREGCFSHMWLAQNLALQKALRILARTGKMKQM